jgi:hypothetical protein
LTETEKRIEHRIYYKLNLDAFDDLMLQHSGSEESTAVIRTEDLTVYTPLSVFIVVCNQGLLRNDRINFYDDTIKNIKGI